MANLTESGSYDIGVYQLETTDPVLAGPGGVLNTQGQQLANRTGYLKTHVDALEAAKTVATHEADADPHAQYELESNKGSANGYASLDANSKVPDAQLKGILLDTYEQTVHDYGTVTTGTLTPSHTSNGNNHLATVGGNITIAVPVSDFTAGKIDGVLELIGADAYAITWDANWDFGADGTPTLTSKHLIAYERKYGDTKTKAWAYGGFA